MPRVRFLEDFDWTDPRRPSVTIAFKEGMTLLVTTPCARAAIAQARAVPVKDIHAGSIDGG